MSKWLRICKFCGGLIDTLGSCLQCSGEGTQPGHSYCNGIQREVGYYQIFAEADRFESCQCGAHWYGESWVK